MDEATRKRLGQLTDFVVGGALEQFIDTLIHERDAEWNAAIGYTVSSLVLAPSEAAKWLETDRRRQVNEVIAARPRRGPQHY